MDHHTYLRYECADAFGLTVSSASSKAPQCNSVIKCLSATPSSSTSKPSSVVAITTTGSTITGFHLRTGLPVLKVGHRQQLNGGIGTGRSLNSDEIVCLDIQRPNDNNTYDADDSKAVVKIATGWVDGTVRIFELNHPIETVGTKPIGVTHSLLSEESSTEEHEFFYEREPLVLNGHTNQSPIRIVVFDKYTTNRLASGGSDGTIVLWDIISENGIFRLLGHRGPITDISFIRLGMNSNDNNSTNTLKDGLITSSLDGLVKVWDIAGQCCIQTIASHRGEVWAGTCMPLLLDGINNPSETEHQQRWRLITGGNDGQVRVWSVGEFDSSSSSSDAVTTDVLTIDATTSNQHTDTATDATDAYSKSQPEQQTMDGTKSDNDAMICHFIGTLVPSANVAGGGSAISAEPILCIQYDMTGKYVGVLHTNSKNIDIYLIRSIQQSNNKRQRRLRRRQEKLKGKTKKGTEESSSNSNKKRGMLDDPDSSDDDNDDDNDKDESKDDVAVMLQMRDPKLMKASDEFEYITTVRCSHKVRGFTFFYSPIQKQKTPGTTGRELIRIVCALFTNALETHAIVRQKQQQQRNDDGEKGNVYSSAIVIADKLNVMDMYGHPTGIRSVALSSDDKLACTVSKNVTKIWNVQSRSCILSLSPTLDVGTVSVATDKKKTKSKNSVALYGLCTVFLPGNMHVVVGTREGHLIIINISAGDIVYVEEKAHDGAIWSIDLKRPSQPTSINDDSSSSVLSLVTGSADKSVKFWSITTSQDDDESDSNDGNHARCEPMLVHTRTLQMADDVVAVRYSNSLDSSKRLVFVSTLDCTIKVFFDDSLKLFLSLYGHKLPALAIDGSDDDVLLASAGADKTIKIWGLDFGDTHRTLHGHGDSITDLRFVKRTHYFFTCSKDYTVRYWDGDRFEQILLLNGHSAEVNCLAVSRTGAFVLTGGMDRQIRVWERTKDMVFLEEERERDLEQAFDKINDRDEGGTGRILDRKQRANDNDDYAGDDMEGDDAPQSEAAVRKSILGVSSGDRIMEALERADQELKDIATYRRAHGVDEKRQPNLLMLGLEPADYILWILRTVKSSELEQSLIILPLSHLERLMYYLILLLKSCRGIELCSRVAVFIVKTHQRQIIATRSMITPLQELRRLLRRCVSETRDVVGFDLAALKVISRVANDRKHTFIDGEAKVKDIWAGLGLGSDVAAVLQGNSNKSKR